MSGEDLSVSFGADTSNFNKAITDARSTVGQFSADTRSSATPALQDLARAFDASYDASTRSSAGWRDNLQALANFTIVARGAIDAVKELADVEVSGDKILFSAEFATDKASLHAASDLFGDLRAAVASVTETIAAAPTALFAYADALAHGTGEAHSFITEQEGIAASVGRATLGIRTLITELRLYQTDAARDTLGAIFAAGGGDAFVREIDKAGVGLKEAITGFQAQLYEIPQMTDEAATKIEAMLGSVPNYSMQANDELIKLIATISATGDAAVANTQKLSAGLKDQTAAGGAAVAELAKNLQSTKDIVAATQTLTSIMSPEAGAAFYQAMIDKLQKAYALEKTKADANAAALQREGVLGTVISMGMSHQVELQRQQNEERKAAIELLQHQAELTKTIVDSGAKEQTFRDTLDKSNPIDAQIEDVSSKITILQNKLSQGTGDAPKLTAEDIDTLVRTVVGEAGGESAKGQLAVAAVALNRLANGNFGESLEKLLKAGDGSQFNVWKPGDATKAQAMDPSDYRYQRTLQDIVMPLLQKQVADPTNGALNFYNPRTTPAANQFGMDDTTTIGNHLFGTAKNAPAPIAPLTPDEAEATEQALQKYEDELKRLNDLKEGGNATDQAGLEIAQQQAAGLRDQLTEAQKLVDAAKAEVLASSDGTPDAKRKAAEALAKAEDTLRQRQMAEEEAASRVEVQATEQSSYERAAIENKALADKLAGLRQGSAEYSDILAKMIANTRGAVEQEKKDQAAAEDAKYQNALRTLQEQEADVHAAAAEGHISREQELADVTTNLKAQETLHRTHQATLKEIWGEGTAGFRTAQKQQEEIVGTSLHAQQQAVREYQKEVEASYRSAFEGIASNLASSFEQMLEGTMTLRKLMQTTARYIASQFIQENARAAADFLAHKAAEIATQQGTEAAKTGAVAAGESARTGLFTIGALEQDAAVVGSVVKQIGAYAAEAFAGVTAFLSPILGPAAVGVASGVEAVVLGAGSAIPGFATGAWSLPSDMVATVHQGEMIIPATFASSLRSAVGGGDGGGGGGHTFNFNIDGSKSPAETMAHIRGNIRDVLRLLNDGWKYNDSLKPF